MSSRLFKCLWTPMVGLVLLSSPPFTCGDVGAGPNFVAVPPTVVRFSNSTGTTLRCSATGDPKPSIEWHTANGEKVSSLDGILTLSPDNSTLKFHPFSSQQYSSKVHANVFVCSATNWHGVVTSPSTNLRAIVDQGYDLQVFPAYAYLGNTAVLKCLMPPFVRDYLSITTWMWGSTVISTNIDKGGRYSVFPDGELHIRNVSMDDAKKPFRCLAEHMLTGKKTVSSIAGRLSVQSIDQAGTMPVRIDSSRSIIFAENGAAVELPCVGLGLPTPQYLWTRHQGGLEVSVRPDPSHGIYLYGGSLFIPRARASVHNGIWTCRAKNPLGEESVSMRLKVASPLNVRVEPDRQRVDVGDEARLTCHVDGFPVRSVYWLHNGQPLSVGKGSAEAKAATVTTLVSVETSLSTWRKHTTEDSALVLSANNISWDGKTLIIKAVSRRDHGMYQCMAQGENDDHVAMATSQLDLGDSRPSILATFNHQVVQPGQPLSLECTATGSPVPVLEWRLDGQILHSTRQMLMHNEKKSDRASLTVAIANLQPDQSGLYECQAENYMGKGTRNARIDVFGPPFVRNMNPRSIVAGSSVWLHCPYGGHPIDKVLWSKGGEELPVNERQLVYRNGSLALRRVLRNDAGQYMCSVYAGRLKATETLSISVMVAPRIDAFRFATGLQEGGRARVACTAGLGDLPIRFQWFVGSVELKMKNDGKDDIKIMKVDEFTSSLSFPRLQTSHSGNYTCVASNAAAKDVYSASLVVSVPPRWQSPPKDTTSMSGESVLLDCQAAGTPQPTVTWSKADPREKGRFLRLEALMSNFKVYGNGSLIITRTSAENEGHYLCRADNTVGEGISKLAEVTVNVPATFEEPFQNRTVVAGEKAIIKCPVLGDNPIKVRWMKNHKYLGDESHFKVKEEITETGMMSKLVVQKARREDSALFQCMATNQFGNSQRSIKFIVQEPPEVPGQFRIISYSSRTTNFSWIRPYDGRSPITAFLLQYKLKEEPWKSAKVHSAPGNVTWSEIRTLMPFSAYQVRLMAVNSVGKSLATLAVDINTKEEVPEGTPTDIRAVANTSQSLLVAWKPPHPDLQHGKILGYYLGYKVANSSDPFRYRTLEVYGPGHKLQLLLANLKKFTQYSIVVQAYNRIGAGPRSEELTVTTAEDVPSSPPRNVQCTPLSSTSLLIMWSPPPVADMNGILQEYRIFYRPLHEWEEKVEILEQSTMQHKLTLYGLDRYQNYTVQVVASTKVGEGLKSRSIYCRTKEDLPGPPANIKAVALDQHSVLMSWLCPENPNGKVIGYTVHLKTMENGRQFTQKFAVGPQDTFYTVRGLNQNQPYSFWVTASTMAGEGELSTIVAETPQVPVPGAIASFSQRIIHAVKESASLSCVTVGQPKPSLTWKRNGQPLGRSNSRIRLEDSGAFLKISSLEMSDTANYSCYAQNHFGRDQITYYLQVKLSRNNGVPPAPPTLIVTSTSSSTISLSWKPSTVDGGAPLTAYRLHYHREFGDWDRVDVQPNQTEYTFKGLRCGTLYQFYIQALNDFGVGERTETVSAPTRGSAPHPPHSDQLLSMNSSSIVLALSSWGTGGCPVSSFVVEYKQRRSPTEIGDNSWVLVNNNVKLDSKGVSSNSGSFSVLDLSPGTRYTLRMTAHNSAGSTVQEYDFTTLTFNGATIAPELIIHSEYSGFFLTEPSVIFPLLLAIVIIVGVVVFIYKRVKKDLAEVERPKSGRAVSEADLIQAPDRQLVPNLASSPMHFPTYMTERCIVHHNDRQQMLMNTLSRKGACPAPGGALEAEYHLPHPTVDVCSPPQQQTQLSHHIPDESSSRFYNDCYTDTSSGCEGGYATIKLREEGTATDWIPMRQLFNAHRL